MTTFRDALAAGPLVLDGGMSNELEAQGHDLSGALWSARLLRDSPEAIRAVHRAYYAAGAQVAITASYQATYVGFARLGISRAETTALLQRSVALAREAAAGTGWVAASVGPYGAMLADGSEYRGDYGLTVAELTRFHRPRLEALAEAAPDVFAVETIPDLGGRGRTDRPGRPGHPGLALVQHPRNDHQRGPAADRGLRPGP